MVGGEGTTNFNFGGMDVVPLLGASVLWCGGEVRPTLRSGRVPLLGAIVGAIVVCYG